MSRRRRLTLMNDPLVVSQAGSGPTGFWPVRRNPTATGSTRLYETALRPAPDRGRSGPVPGLPQGPPGTSHDRLDPAAWADLCHVLINVKEFIFID